MTTANPLKSNGSASNAIPLSIENMENEIQRLQSINNELVAALRNVVAWTEPFYAHEVRDFESARDLLDRAESATPNHLRGVTEMVAPAKLPAELTPVFQVAGEDCLLETPKMAAVPQRLLKQRVAEQIA